MSIKFCGMTVENVNVTLGWNESQSKMGIDLILDSGDFNLIPPEGYPVYFSYGALNFNGILQKTEEDMSTSGRKFKCYVVDPREILRCCSLIIGGYSGALFNIKNIVNCFAYFENRLGFGSSNVTSAGMPWYLIREAINQVVNVPSDSAFGGPLNYKGIRYSVDLSEVPTMPAFYRINATSINLFDAISQVCKDANMDFFVTLHGYRIKINTVSKGRIASAGSLGNYVRNVMLNSQIAVSGSFGREDVHQEATSVLLVGAEKEDLYQTSNIVSFWGYDQNNDPIFGEKGWKLWVPALGKNIAQGYDFYNGKVDFPKNFPMPKCFILKYEPQDLRNLPSDFTTDFTAYENENFVYDYIKDINIEMVNLNSTIVSDIVRSNVYKCSTLEMRFALTDIGAWEEFIENVKPGVYELIYGFKPFDPKRKNVAVNNADVIKDNKQKVKKDLMAAEGDVSFQRLQRLYSFVRYYAEEFYGRKFACSLPLIASTIDLETLQIKNAADIVRSAYKPEGSQPLGITELNESFFVDQTNKFSAFCSIFAPGTLLDGMSSNSIVQGNVLYEGVSVEEQILRTRTSLAAIFTLSAPLQEKADNIFGNLEVVAAIKKLCKNAFISGFPLFAKFESIAPERRYPLSVAIPLKSNVERYGPFWISGSPGKTEYIEDNNLAPWNFGGYEAMSIYALAQLDFVAGTNQYIESGQFTLAGSPLIDLGAFLDGVGPTLTDLSTTLSISGITTTYTFKAYSPRNGELTRQFAERLRSVSLTSQKLRKELRDNIKETLALRQISKDARKAVKFDEMIKKELRRNTPHDVIVSSLYHKNLDDDNVTSNRKLYSQISNLAEALTMMSASNDKKYKFNTIMSLNGLFCPFSLDTSYSAAMPKIPIIAKFSTNIITCDSYNHFGNNSIDVLGIGDKYDGVKPDENTLVKNLKPVALRGPIWINGYGPNMKDLNGFKADKTEANPKDWMVGPLDAVYDNYRGVWTFHTLIIGVAKTNITPANNFSSSPSIGNLGYGGINIYCDSPESENLLKNSSGQEIFINCRNPFAKQIDVGVMVMAQYSPYYNCYVLIAADCV